MPAQLARHLEERCCLPVLYMSAWLLTGFASSFPLPFAARVMDVLLTDSCSEATMKVRCHMPPSSLRVHMLPLPLSPLGHACSPQRAHAAQTVIRRQARLSTQSAPGAP